MTVPLSTDPDRSWRAWTTHDRRFDGRIFMGVASTGIYCRPVCPARLPARRNARFFATAAAAEAAGFRPCRRCRPETAPGSPAWQGTSATLARALRLIEAGELDAHGVEGVAQKLGVTSRWLRKLFEEQLGASPLDVALTRRVHVARRLLDETTLPLIDIALASGFGGERQLRAAIRRTFRRAPSELRGRAAAGAPGALALRVPARAPFDAAPLLAFFAMRAIPGVEQVDGTTYRRTIALDSGPATLAVETHPGEAHVTVRLDASPGANVLPVVARVAQMFDLAADAEGIAVTLRRADPRLAQALRRGPVRVPGAWDPFELAVRALLGQQISVAAARTIAARLVSACGTPLAAPRGALTHLFPGPDAVAAAPLESLGLPRARATALRGLARAVASGAVSLESGGDPDAVIASLVALPGIGPWTAHYIALRALREPDAFPAGDLVVRQALAEDGALPPERDVLARAERWRPFRAYATIALWRDSPPPSRRKETAK